MQILIDDSLPVPATFSIQKSGFFTSLLAWQQWGKMGNIWYLGNPQQPQPWLPDSGWQQPEAPVRGSRGLAGAWLHRRQVKRLIRELGIELLILPVGRALPDMPVPQVLWLPELPQSAKTALYNAWKKSLPSTLDTCTEIWTPSQKGSAVLRKAFPSLAAKTRWVPLMADTTLSPLVWMEKKELLGRLSGGREYFLVCTAGEADLMPVFKAFTRFKKSLRSNMQLVITAIHSTKTNEWRTRLETYIHREDVQWHDYPSREELLSWVSAAYAVIGMEPNDLLFADACACRAPLIILESGLRLIGPVTTDSSPVATDEKNLADLLMQLYKDERKRNEWVEKASKWGAQTNRAEAFEIWQRALSEVTAVKTGPP